MKKVILIGFMGAGKSTLGRRIHQASGMPFFDLDDWIEAREGRKIGEIFRQDGEAAFRALESKALDILSDELPGEWVLSCGGGTPCFGDNMEKLRKMGTTVYLKLSPELLASRLLPEKEHRPLISGYSEAELVDFIRDLLNKREMFYKKAHLHLKEDEVDDWFLKLMG